MADFPLVGATRYATYGADATTSRGTSVTSSTANVKGSYVQLAAATDFAATGFYIWQERGADSWDDFLMDFATGAAASEQVVVPNLLFTQGSNPEGRITYWPIPLDAGVRLSARVQSTGNSLDLRTQVMIVGQGFGPTQPLGRATAYGATTADSGGISIDPGGVANTKGAYSQITASTTYNINAINIALGNQTNADRAADGHFSLDIAIGAGGSEYVILADLKFKTTLLETLNPGALGPFYVHIPAGTRIAARAQSSITDATDRLFDVAIYGMD